MGCPWGAKPPPEARKASTRSASSPDGHGVHAVLEAVGNMPAYQQAYGILRPGGVISRVGVPQYEDAPIGFGSLFRHNVRRAGAPRPFAPTSRS
jgi:threonine dehydrogenase-like Zn-dependent dehydrogenase